MALLARAARLVGPRARGGRILVQTFLPEHMVLQAAVHADPGKLAEEERTQRESLGLPPFGAYAEIAGKGSDEFVASLPPEEGVIVAKSGEGYVARANDWMTLGKVLSEGERKPGRRLRIAVDPPRWHAVDAVPGATVGTIGARHPRPLRRVQPGIGPGARHL